MKQLTINSFATMLTIAVIGFSNVATAGGGNDMASAEIVCQNADLGLRVLVMYNPNARLVKTERWGTYQLEGGSLATDWRTTATDVFSIDFKSGAKYVGEKRATGARGVLKLEDGTVLVCRDLGPL